MGRGGPNCFAPFVDLFDFGADLFGLFLNRLGDLGGIEFAAKNHNRLDPLFRVAGATNGNGIQVVKGVNAGGLDQLLGFIAGFDRKAGQAINAKLFEDGRFQNLFKLNADNGLGIGGNQLIHIHRVSGTSNQPTQSGDGQGRVQPSLFYELQHGYFLKVALVCVCWGLPNAQGAPPGKGFLERIPPRVLFKMTKEEVIVNSKPCRREMSRKE